MSQVYVSKRMFPNVGLTEVKRTCFTKSLNKRGHLPFVAMYGFLYLWLDLCICSNMRLQNGHNLDIGIMRMALSDLDIGNITLE